jgi:hypothetical protein
MGLDGVQPIAIGQGGWEGMRGYTRQDGTDANMMLMLVAGLAVFTIFKAGFVFSGKAGSGLVVAKLPDGSWSAPSCIATAGEFGGSCCPIGVRCYQSNPILWQARMGSSSQRVLSGLKRSLVE